MEDEVDYSFLTQEEYEEAIIDEQISEEAVYQEDGQGGYNLRSRLIASPNKNVVLAKQPTALAKKVTVLPKKWLSFPNSCKNQYIHQTLILSNSKLQYRRQVFVINCIILSTLS